MNPSAQTFRLTHLSTTHSTMDVARDAAEAGEADGFVVLADEQAGGRGRRGRVWHSPRGNLYASLLIEPLLQPQDYGHFSFVAALALARSLPDTMAAERVRLKWPNDVLVDGAKIAGILLEACIKPEHKAMLIIGFGLNITHHPLETSYRATSLAALGCAIDQYPPRTMLEYFLSAFTKYRAVLEREGFAPIQQAWLAQASGLGDLINVHLPDQEMKGHFEGIDENGRLLLRLPTGILRPIAAGDVSMRTG